MFTESCIIKKKTSYLRGILRTLGLEYVPNGAGEWFIPIEDCPYLVADRGKYYGTFGKWDDNIMDCGRSDSLFLAVAGFRDDTDKKQWFVSKDGWWTSCNSDEFKNFFSSLFRKATLEEVIEHFKERE